MGIFKVDFKKDYHLNNSYEIIYNLDPYLE